MRGALVGGALQVGAYVLGYALNFALARWLGAAEFGRYSYTMTIYGLAGLIATGGFGASAVKFVPQYLGAGDRERLRRFLGVGHRTIVALALGLSLAAGALLYWLPGLFGPYVETFRYGLPLILLGAFVTVYRETLRAMGAVVAAYLPMQILRPVLVLAAVWTFLAKEGRVDAGDVIVIVAATLAVVVISQSVAIARRVRPSAGPEGRAGGEAQERIVPVSVTLLGSSLLAVLLTQADVLLLGLFVAPQQVGAYSIAFRLAAICRITVALVNIRGAPAYAALHGAGRIAEMQTLAMKLAHIVFWPALLVCVVVGFFAQDILSVFGKGYEAAATALIVLLIGQMINVSMGSVGYLVDLTGHHRAGLHVRAITLLLMVLLALVLIPRFGLLGAAMSSAVGMVIWNLALYLVVVRRVGVRPSIVDALLMRRASSDGKG